MSVPLPPWEEYDKHYKSFLDKEDVPIHTGLFVEDVRETPVSDWERTGGRVAFINLKGMEGICDIQIHEIPPGDQLHQQRHLHESLVWVIGGSGFTTIGSADERTTFEWDKDSVFYLPQNTPYTHRNAQEEEPVRLLTMTSLPLMYTLFKNDQIIWENKEYDQWSVVKDDEFYASMVETRSGTDKGGHARTYWESNFVPNAASFDRLESREKRGGGSRSIYFPLRNTSFFSHISEFPTGKYKKAHRHLSGANVIMLSGEGYTLLWQPQSGQEERIRIDWEPYALFTPPTMWFHQFFNTSEEPARYLVLHGPLQGTGIRPNNDAMRSTYETNQIEYYQEEPEIREQFKRELKQKGIEYQMSDEAFEK